MILRKTVLGDMWGCSPHCRACLNPNLQPKVRDWIEQSIEEGSIFYDIGAHVGWFSIAALKAGARYAYAFEPCYPAATALKANAELHKYLLLDWAVAAWSKTGSVKMVHLSQSAGNYVSLDEGIQVPAIAIDDINIPPPDVVKLDCQGSELAAILGMQNKLETAKFVICEVSPALLPRTGHSAKELFAWFDMNGFKMLSEYHPKRVWEDVWFGR